MVEAAVAQDETTSVKLSKFIRLEIYKYLAIKDILKGPATTSRKERSNLRESHIVRKGKKLGLRWFGNLQKDC